jgi:hypothetical protein
MSRQIPMSIANLAVHFTGDAQYTICKKEPLSVLRPQRATTLCKIRGGGNKRSSKDNRLAGTIAAFLLLTFQIRCVHSGGVWLERPTFH